MTRFTCHIYCALSVWVSLITTCGCIERSNQPPVRETVIPRDTETGFEAHAANQPVCDLSGATFANRCSSPPRRVIAIGDLHGNLASTLQILKVTGLIDDENQWIGADAVLVQVGDQIDRGDFDREIVDFMDRLETDASRYGGAVHSMLGNHDIKSVDFDFRWVSTRSFESFGDIPFDPFDPQLSALESLAQGRAAAFRPTGPYAAILAKRTVMLNVMGTVFSHAGIMPRFAAMGIRRINDEIRAWLLGRGQRPDDLIDSGDSPIQSRNFGAPDPTLVDCDAVRESLAILGAERMVIGHTIQQQGVNWACDGLVWRIDVGIYEGTRIGALEIYGDQVTPVTFEWDSPEKYAQMPTN